MFTYGSRPLPSGGSVHDWHSFVRRFAGYTLILSLLALAQPSGAASDSAGTPTDPFLLSVGVSPVATCSRQDSLPVLRTAKHALRVHHSLFIEYMHPPFFDVSVTGAAARCEKTVAPYCFGPRNGDIPFGRAGYGIAVEFRTWEPNVPKYLRRTVNGLVQNLMRALDDAQKKLPGDRWIVGQRVFHLVHHGEIERAQKVARDCRSDVYWCASLVGFTSYLLNQFPRADSAFAVSLAALSEAERCRYDDIADLLYDDGLRSWYTRLTCADRQAANETAWWLSDPLFLTPGNERMAAHYFRQVYAKLFMDSNEAQAPLTNLNGTPSAGRRGLRGPTPPLSDRRYWDHGALPSILVSLGVPSFLFETAGQDGEGALLLQYRQPTYHFIPSLEAVRNPLRATAEQWSINDATASERYHPLFGRLSEIDTYQLAWFERGDSARVVAAVDLESIGLYTGRQRGRDLATSALIMAKGPQDIGINLDTLKGYHLNFDIMAPAESTVIGIETLALGIGAARTRFASGPPLMPSQRVRVSDMLLVDDSAANVLAAPTLESAIPHALRRNTIREGASMGLFWEIYGLNVGDTVSTSLTAIETGVSGLRRLGGLLGIGRDAGQTASTWSEVLSVAGPIAGRAVRVNLSSLRRGDYVLELSVSVPGQQTVAVRRSLRVSG